VGADPSVGNRAVANFLDGGVFVGGTARVGGIVDGVRNAVDESNHGVFPVTDVITEPQTEHT